MTDAMTDSMSDKKPSSHKRWLIFALALPIIVLCLLIVRAEIHIGQSKVWTFDVGGYDPRDLLRGHYLRFNIQFDWQSEANSCQGDNDCCLCLTDNGDSPPKVYETSCPVAKTQCDGFMRSEFRRELNRYYVAETDAKRAETILLAAQAKNDAKITLAINQAGTPQIVDLLIAGRTLESHLESTEQPEDK
jgi:uncharacterized membrane-anchored protein